MRRIVIWIASTVTVAVLVFGYHTSTSSDAAATGSTTSSSPSSSGASSTPAASGPPSSSGSSSGSSRTKKSSSAPSSTRTYTGTAASTRYGPVQVQIIVAVGKITDVAVPQSPSSSPRDVQIADRALPVLVRETISAQSAKIDMVSGATYTSDGYVTSLQSALDQAGI